MPCVNRNKLNGGPISLLDGEYNDGENRSNTGNFKQYITFI